MAAVELSFEVSRPGEGDTAVLTLTGEIDAYTAPRLREQLVELAGDNKNLVINLEGVSFLDSTGLGVLVSGLKRFRSEGGDLVVVCTHPQVCKVFEITGLTKVIRLFESVEVATDSLPNR